MYRATFQYKLVISYISALSHWSKKVSEKPQGLAISFSLPDFKHSFAHWNKHRTYKKLILLLVRFHFQRHLYGRRKFLFFQDCLGFRARNLIQRRVFFLKKMMKFFRGKENSPDVSSLQSPSPPLSSSASSLSSIGTGPARPIRLVYCDEKGKFRMDPEAVATLQLVKGPIGVVSVCGRARQGKSFILNQVSLRLSFILWWILDSEN